VPVVIGWELAASLWWHHLPHPLTDRYRCAACGLRAPCRGWQFADAFLADVLLPPAVDEPTRELLQVKPPLPKRQRGASMEPEARFDRWFTQSD